MQCFWQLLHGIFIDIWSMCFLTARTWLLIDVVYKNDVINIPRCFCSLPILFNIIYWCGTERQVGFKWGSISSFFDRYVIFNKWLKYGCCYRHKSTRHLYISPSCCRNKDFAIYLFSFTSSSLCKLGAAVSISISFVSILKLHMHN